MTLSTLKLVRCFCVKNGRHFFFFFDDKTTNSIRQNEFIFQRKEKISKNYDSGTNKEIFVFENTLFSLKSSFKSTLNCGLGSGKFSKMTEKKANEKKKSKNEKETDLFCA